MKFANRETVQTLIAKKSAMLVDMRTPVHVRDMPVAGAVNLPLRNLINTLTNLTAKDKKRKTPVILFGVNSHDPEVKSGITYSEDLGFQTYVTDYNQVK